MQAANELAGDGVTPANRFTIHQSYPTPEFWTNSRHGSEACGGRGGADNRARACVEPSITLEKAPRRVHHLVERVRMGEGRRQKSSHCPEGRCLNCRVGGRRHQYCFIRRAAAPSASAHVRVRLQVVATTQAPCHVVIRQRAPLNSNDVLGKHQQLHAHSAFTSSPLHQCCSRCLKGRGEGTTAPSRAALSFEHQMRS